MTKTEKLNPADLSHANKILISMFRASKGTTQRTPFESIVLQAWRDFPEDFSLSNNPEFPDSSVIAKRLYGDLISKRMVVSLKNGIYRLSDKGLLEAQRIIDFATIKKENNANIDVRLNRDEEQFLDNALRSKTFSVWKRGDKQDLIDYDARVFFQFSTGTPIKERKRRVETAQDALKKATALNMPESIELKELFDFLVHNFPQLFQEK